MIPKIIHYCWFGRQSLPKLATKCITSWKKFLPNYNLIKWNEENFPVDKYSYSRKALDLRKYSFVSDVCRLYALKELGGIYMDVDVEVLKSFDDLLHLSAFSGFENDNFVPTGVMGSEKDGRWVNELLSYYTNLPLKVNGSVSDFIPNTLIITKMMIAKGFVMNNSFQEIKDYVTFYPNDYFCPKSYKTGMIKLTGNSYCIHHFAKSWIRIDRRLRNIIKMKLMNIFGFRKIQKLIDIVKKAKL